MPGVGPGFLLAQQAGQASLGTAGYDTSTPAATVTYGEVTVDDTATATMDPSAVGNSVFDEFIINSRFEGDNHRYMMGITSETPFQGASVAFCQLASPTVLWIADWTCLVNGTIKIPDPEASSQDWILLDAHLEPAAVVQNIDGETPIYRISGTYVYGHKNPKSSITQNVIIPRMPWVVEGVFQTTILAANLDNTLLTPQGGGQNVGGPGMKKPNTTPTGSIKARSLTS